MRIVSIVKIFAACTFLAIPAGLSSFALLAGVVAAADLTPVPAKSGAVSLSPQNTTIEFVCAHVGPRPDPRKGNFGKFTGTARIDPATKTLQSVNIEIDTASLSTAIDRLTNHLKSPDFFDVRRFPTARFESTKIDAGSTGQITGKLTMHGVTKEISFPATIQVTDAGLTVEASFSIDRSQFGMNYDPTKVENKVDLTVAIGKKS
jgi:polyisoprenoid-binding protein YceI